MHALIIFSELNFTGYSFFLAGTLVVWGILLANENLKKNFSNKPRTAAQDYWFPQGKDDDDDKNKSRWERFKDWCSRNKVYIGLGILATVAVVAAVMVYSSGSTPPEVPPADLEDRTLRAKQRSGLDKLEWTNEKIDYFTKKTVAQVGLEFMSDENFISPGVPESSLTGADILAREGVFLKQMLVVFDYYKKTPPTELAVQEQLATMTNFLKYNLHILDDVDQYQFHNWSAMKDCLRAYGRYLDNWDEADVAFKHLFNFLTQSPAPGAHQEALDAYRKLSVDFLTKTLAKEIDL